MAQCHLCQKPVCEKHIRVLANKRVCVSCHKDRTKDQKRPEADRRDPYYYSAFYYEDYDTYSSYDRYSMSDREAFNSDSSDGSEWSEDWGDNWEDDYDGS